MNEDQARHWLPIWGQNLKSIHWAQRSKNTPTKRLPVMGPVRVRLYARVSWGRVV